MCTKHARRAKRKKTAVHGTLEIHFKATFVKDTYSYDHCFKSYLRFCPCPFSEISTRSTFFQNSGKRQYNEKIVKRHFVCFNLEIDESNVPIDFCFWPVFFRYGHFHIFWPSDVKLQTRNMVISLKKLRDVL